MNWKNSTVNERVRYVLRELFNGNTTAMAKATFISRSSINNIVGETETLPGYEIIKKLLEAKDGIINPNWLISGSGEMLKREGNNSIDLVPELPLDVSAGFTDDIQNGIMPTMCSMAPRIPGMPSYALTISVRGDSMEPTFESGDKLALRRCYDIIEWGAPHVLDTSEGVYVKRIKEDTKNVVCLSDNPDYPTFTIPKQCIRGIYKVVGLLRTF